MNYEILQQLVGIYNNLLRVHTCGVDSFIMTDCMRALLEIIKNETQQEKSENSIEIEGE